LATDASQEGYDNKRQLEELIHVAGICIEVLQQNDEYLADVSCLQYNTIQYSFIGAWQNASSTFEVTR